MLFKFCWESKLFDKIIVAALKNPSKTYLFSIQERLNILSNIFKNDQNIEVDSFEGLLVDYLEKKKATADIQEKKETLKAAKKERDLLRKKAKIKLTSEAYATFNEVLAKESLESGKAKASLKRLIELSKK